MPNPFMPGNGIEPRYLAGRERHLRDFSRSLEVYEEGLPQNTVLFGLRGTGKTVLLRRFKVAAENRGWLTVDREFSERYGDESAFSEAVVRDMVSKAVEVSLLKKVKETGKRVADFLKPAEIGISDFTYRPLYKGKEDLLEDYLKEALMNNWAIVEKSERTGVVFLYDEFHTVRDDKARKSFPLSSFLSAIGYAQRNGCKYSLVLSGLPAIKTNLKKAKTYTERMFNFREVGNLSEDEAKTAIDESLTNSGFDFTDKLTDRIVSETKGYPYFIQFYGYFLVERTGKKMVKLDDFLALKESLLRELDVSFFEDRFNIASEREKQVLTAMAKEGPDDISVQSIRTRTGFDRNLLNTLLLRLTEKGLVYRKTKGRYSFSLPLFRDFILRQ